MKRNMKELEESIRFFDALRYTAIEADIERAHEEQAEKEAARIREIFKIITESKAEFDASEEGVLWYEDLAPVGSLPPAAGNDREDCIPDLGTDDEETGEEQPAGYSGDDYISARELQKKAFKPKEPLIEGFLYPGTYIFAGAPKVGKSFAMAGITCHVSSGEPMWGYKVNRGTVLYLALEDTEERLQSRYSSMYGKELPKDLYFMVSAKPIDQGLLEDLERFVSKHPDTKLIVIDTLQKIRSKKSSYENDYDMVGTLKAFADRRNLCMLLVHHTRKQDSSDKFNTISGSQGLNGAADGAYIMYKTDRQAQKASILMTGRDIPDKKLRVCRDCDTLEWQLEGEGDDPEEDPKELIRTKIAEIVTANNGHWIGTATELALEIGPIAKRSTITKIINEETARLQLDYGIKYNYGRNYKDRHLEFTAVDNSETGEEYEAVLE